MRAARWFRVSGPDGGNPVSLAPADGGSRPRTRGVATDTGTVARRPDARAGADVADAVGASLGAGDEGASCGS